jgi:hypothetical protein
MTEKLIFEEFDKYFTAVEEETKEKEKQIRYQLWIDWYSNWIDLYRWLDGLVGEKKFESLLVFRSFEFLKQMLWVCKCVHSGAYHTAIRELRFIFESFVQAYYVDKEHPDSEMVCKLEIIKEMDKLIFGSKLIERTDLHNKKKLIDLYSELSKYVHSSYEQMKPPLKEGKIEPHILFTYDEELFNKCHTFTNKVMDALTFVLMSFENEMIVKIQKDKILMQILKENNCKLSLNLLRKFNN